MCSLAEELSRINCINSGGVYGYALYNKLINRLFYKKNKIPPAFFHIIMQCNADYNCISMRDLLNGIVFETFKYWTTFNILQMISFSQ